MSLCHCRCAQAGAWLSISWHETGRAGGPSLIIGFARLPITARAAEYTERMFISAERQEIPITAENAWCGDAHVLGRRRRDKILINNRLLVEDPKPSAVMLRKVLRKRATGR